MSYTSAQKPQDGAEFPLSISVGSIDSVIKRANHRSHTTEIVLAPVAHHRRTIKRRIAEANRPLVGIDIVEPSTVARRLFRRLNKPTRALDRVDRIDLMESILAQAGEPRDHFRLLLGIDPSKNVQAIERTRSEIESTTNYHPQRVRAYSQTAANLGGTVEADAKDALDGILAVERALRRRVDKAPSTTALIRRATRAISKDQESWQKTYRYVERVTVVGLSNLSAPILDFVTALAQSAGVEGEILLRPATGPQFRRRLPQVMVEHPGEVFVG